MSRKNTNYFSHDSTARNDAKLLRVRIRHGAAGYGVYFMILERLREENDYMSVRDYDMIAFDLREDVSLVQSVIEDFGLFCFSEDGEYFYSESFCRRMNLKDDIKSKRSEAGKKGLAKRWGEKQQNTNVADDDSKVIANATQNDSKTIANGKSGDSKKIAKNFAISSTSEKTSENENECEKIANGVILDSKVIANATQGDSKVIANATEKDSNKRKGKERINNIVVDDCACAYAREDYDGFIRIFFDTHQADVEALCMQMHTSKAALYASAQQIISEWRLRECNHPDGYTDMAAHLINQLRKKQANQKQQQNDSNRQRPQDRRRPVEVTATSSADYSTTF